jgi:acetoin utilization deacetylase AcuC-like enzyme
VAIEEALDAVGWLGLERAEAPAAERAAVERVHAGELIDTLERFCAAGGGMLDLDTVVSRDSFDAAMHAAGGAAWAAERLIAGDDRLAFCAMRPPGHHAERGKSMGFCLFNNAAVGAAHAVAECDAERVLILDWDVHHGNGTEDIFAASSQVLYASIHQSPLYPGTGPADFAGIGEGEGYTVNLPVDPGAGGEEFRALVEHVIVPIARRFEPRLLVISAGFDAHRDDPLASCLLDTGDYRELAALMRRLGEELEAPILVCLEGGYAPGALAVSTVSMIDGLTDSVTPAPAPSEAARDHLARARRHWDI